MVKKDAKMAGLNTGRAMAYPKLPIQPYLKFRLGIYTPPLPPHKRASRVGTRDLPAALLVDLV